MASTLRPVVKIKVGGQEFAISPDYLMEFEEKMILNGYTDVTIKVTDPSYVDLEKRILTGSASNGIIQYCWGYPGGKFTDWREMATLFLLPDIGQHGYQLTISGKGSVAAAVSSIEPQVFQGKISDVAFQVVNALHKKLRSLGSDGIRRAYIEETNDDDPTGVPGSIALPEVVVPPYQPGMQPQNNTGRMWYTGNLSLTGFVRDVLQPYAVSKQTEDSGYIFRITPQRDFHFHTASWVKGRVFDPSSNSFADGKIPDIQVRKFQYLWGVPNGVMRFNPTINSAIIGGSARGWVCSTYDPKSKQFTETAVNRGTLKGREDNPRTLMGPPDPDDPTSTKKADVYIFEPSSVDIGPELAMWRMANHYRYLNESITRATLELVGLPEFVSFGVDEEFCDVEARLPSKNGQPNALHWESGRYKIMDVTHSIREGYSISANLFRSTALDGPFDAKTAKQAAKAGVQAASAMAQDVFRLLRKL